MSSWEEEMFNANMFGSGFLSLKTEDSEFLGSCSSWIVWVVSGKGGILNNKTPQNIHGMPWLLNGQNG